VRDTTQLRRWVLYVSNPRVTCTGSGQDPGEAGGKYDPVCPGILVIHPNFFGGFTSESYIGVPGPVPDTSEIEDRTS
jgi:hypothetical protein